jgi:hypothetical protein
MKGERHRLRPLSLYRADVYLEVRKRRGHIFFE